MDMVIYHIPHWCKLRETGISKPQFSCLQSLDWWTVLTFIFMLPNETSSSPRKLCNLIHNQCVMAFSFRIFQQHAIMHCELSGYHCTQNDNIYLSTLLQSSVNPLTQCDDFGKLLYYEAMHNIGQQLQVSAILINFCNSVFHFT